MKITTILLFICIWMSCSQDTLNSTIQFNKEWIVGSENTFVSKKIHIPSNTSLHIELSTNSLCPNSGVELIIMNSTSIIFHKIIYSFPFSQTISTTQAEEMTFQTEVKHLFNNGECVWLGNVDVSVQY